MLYITIMESKYNIAIVGSGLAGNIISLALAKAGYKIALIDPKSFEEIQERNYDPRTTALSKKSKIFFERLNLWRAIRPFTCMIKNIMVNDGDSGNNIYFKDLNSKTNKPLGFMIRNQDLFKILISAIKKNKNIKKFDSMVNSFFRDQENVSIKLHNKKKIECQLLIAADGKNSFIREKIGISVYRKSYKQKAFIFNVKHTKSHKNLATENFLKHGPLASLPIIQNKSSCYSSIVWSCNHPSYFKIIKYTKRDIEKELNYYLSEYYGKFTIITDVKSWDLSLVKANNFVDTRTLLIGDSAHSIHPLAGQGLNLTLKGIEILYKLAINSRLNKEDIGSDKILNTFNKKQYLNSIAIIFATDKLNFLFSNSNFFLKRARKIGLNVFKNSRVFKNIFKNYASEGKISIK